MSTIENSADRQISSSEIWLAECRDKTPPEPEESAPGGPANRSQFKVSGWFGAAWCLVRSGISGWVAGAGLNEVKEAPGFRAEPSNPGHPKTKL